MRNFPREIEGDLLYRGIDIHDWHQGKPNLTSRRLIVLIDALPRDPCHGFSAYHLERRDGDWSESEYREAALLNHLILMRADQAAIHANHKMKLKLWESPKESIKDQELEGRRTALRAHVVQQMHRGK